MRSNLTKFFDKRRLRIPTTGALVVQYPDEATDAIPRSGSRHATLPFAVFKKAVAASLAFLFLFGAVELHATAFVVNSSSDANSGSGTMGTLRYCITQANLTPGPHTITFTVPSVTFASDYPQINRQVTIDGGASKVIIAATAGDAPIRPFFLIGGATGSTLKNLDIRGGGYEPIRIDGSPTDITLQNINCSNTAGDYWNYGIFITGNATNYTIDNIVMQDIQNGYEALYIGGTATNVTINKVRMVQAGAGGSTGIRVVGVANTIAITNCLIDLDDEVGNDNGDRGVRFDNNVTGLTMTNDTINRAEIWGIEILGTLTNCTMTNVRYVAGSYGDARGMQVYNTVNGLTMNDCYFDLDVYTTLTPAGDDGNYGIYFNGNVADLNIDNLEMHDAEVYSLFVGGALTGTNSITNSTFDEFDGYGGHEMIRFNSTVNNLTMTNVTIDCDQTGTTDDSNNGIAFVGTVSNTTLTNVSVNEADDNGIYVWTSAVNLSITGGQLTNNYDGIEFYNCNYARTNVDLINIKIDNSTRMGVYFPACTGGVTEDVDFIGDTITNSGQNGIYITYANVASDVTISGCVITGNGRVTTNGDGIEISAPDNVIITQNSIYNNAGLGINHTGNGNCNMEGALAPVINSVTPLGGNQYQVNFTIPVAAGAGTYKAEFFTNNPVAGIEGEYYVSSVSGLGTGVNLLTTITTNSGPAATPKTASLTMTYTRTGASCNGTSEFSNAMALDPQGPGCVNNGIVGWYRADKITGIANGGAISQLLDFSGNGNKFRQFTAGEQPTYFAGDVTTNYNPSMTFSGVNNLEIANGLFPTNTGATLLTAAYHTNTAAGYGVLYDQNTDDPSWLKENGSPLIRFWDNGNLGADISIASLTSNITGISGFDYGTTSGTTHGYFNGLSTAGLGLTPSTEAGIAYIGGRNNTINWLGKIHELIFYNRPLNATERQKVNTYLSIKWGISIDTSIMKVANTNNDYITSDGTVIWTANTGFYKRITGIGRDDCDSLLQKQSRNVDLNSPGYVTMGLGTIAANNAANANNFGANKSFEVWGDDGKVGATTTTITGDGVVTLMGGTCSQYSRLAKTFRVQETGTVGAVQLKFNMTGVKLGKTAADYYLAIHSTSTFNGTIDQLVAATSYNNVTGDLVFDNVNFASNAVRYFTVVGQRVYGPANITSNLKLWLKAEDGVAASDGGSMAIWSDQGPGGSDVVQTVATQQPTYHTTTNLVNFNPSVNFNNANSQILYNLTGLLGTSSYTGNALFVVNKPTTLTTGRPLWQPTAGSYISMSAPYSNGNAYYDYGSGTIFTTSGGAAGRTGIWSGYSRNTPSNSQNLFSNAKSLTTGAGSPNYNGNNTALGIGGRKDCNCEYFNGLIPEVIIYSGGLTDLEAQKIHSYLAIKYGVTLDQTTNYNYVASDGNPIWNAATNATYKNRITGIGRDDCSDLIQRQSRNQDTTSAYATIGLATIAATNAANTGVFSADKSFLVWGDDNVAGASSSTVTGDGVISLNPTSCGVFRRLAKTFKAVKTGTIGNVQVQVNLRGVTLGKVAADFYLAINSTATFSGVITKLVQASSYSNGVVTFNNVPFASADQYFTVIGIKTAGPANITSNLKLWLRAEDGITLDGGTGTINFWGDQGPSANDFTQATAAAQPTWNTATNLINFNPTVTFAGSDYLRSGSNIFGTGNISYTTFGIVDHSALSGHHYYFADGAATTSQAAWFGHQVALQAQANWANDLAAGTVLVNTPYLQGFTRDAATNTKTNYQSAKLMGSNSSGAINKTNNGWGEIGANTVNTELWNGKVGEVIAFQSVLSPTDQQKIYSYLAVKWGFTLDQTTPYNYVSAAGSTIWDAVNNPTYKNRITGIGAEACSDLQQKQSKSVETGALVTISNGTTIAATNDLNTSTFAADNSWLLFGDNGKGLTWTGSGVPINGGNVRLNRVWRVKETGTVGTVYLEVPDNSSALTDKLPATTNSIYLLVANSASTGRFNALSGVTTQLMTYDATNKKWYTTYNFTDGDYFTFGSEKTCIAPVGISEGLTSWYHATNLATGASGSTLSDQAFGVYPLTLAGSATVVAGSATNFNYNRSITLGSNAAYSRGSLTNSDVIDAAAGSMFAVGTANANLFAISSNASNSSGLGANALFNNTTSAYGSGVAGKPNIYSMIGSTAGVTGYTNGTGAAASAAIAARAAGTYTLGFGRNGSNAAFNNGSISEAFTFDRVLDPEERLVLESYLAIKYGQTLSHNYFNADYDGTNAATTTIYDVSTYPERVFGIGTDTTGCFYQKQSTSVLAGSMLKMNIDTFYTAENSSNTGVFLQDRSYVMAGDDNGSIAAWLTGGGANPSAPKIYETSCEVPKRLGRQWKVTGTYTTPTIRFAIPDATSSESTELPAVTAGYSVWMVVNENTDFGVNASQQEIPMTLNATTLNWEGWLAIAAGKTKYITFVMKNDAIATGATSPTIAITETDNSCTSNDSKVLSGAAATLTTSGGGTYLWSTGATTDAAMVNPTMTSTYTVTVTATNGCTASATAVVTVISAPTVSITETDASCTINDGKVLSGASATLTASGSGTYLWDDMSPAAAHFVSPTATTTYTVTLTNSNGCTVSATSVVTVVSAPTVSITETDASCTINDSKVLSGASATLTASGTGTYSWDNSSTAAARTVNPMATTTYTVTLTDANGCTVSATSAVTVVSAPTVSITETDVSCTVNDGKILNGASAMLTANGSGTYAWDNLSTAAARTVSPVATTTYTVTLTDANGCTASATSAVAVVSAPTVSITETDNSCTVNDGKVLNGGSATLTASAGGTYVWDDLSTTAARTVNPVSNTTYTVTLTDANGCTASATSAVTVVSAPTVSITETDNSCTANDSKVISGVSAILTAVGTGTYSWDNLSTAAARTVNPAVTTTYTVTLTDANGCTASATAAITVVSAPTVSITETDASCTVNDGKILNGASALLTASGSGTYSWDNASTAAARVVNPAVTTTYTVTLTDGNGCTISATSAIQVVSAPTVSIAETDNSCTANDSKILSGASATLIASGSGGTYLWDNASTAGIRLVTPTMTTTYTVTLTDANGCTVSSTAAITVGSAPTVSITETDNSCAVNDGKILNGSSATLTANGTGTFLWDNLSSAAARSVSPTSNTTYTVTLTDANGCTVSATSSIVIVSLPTAVITETDNSCVSNDGIIAVGGSATLTASGGATYQWDNASTAAARSVSPVTSTTYTVTVTDANGCADTETYSVAVIIACGVNLNARAFLGGAYEAATDKMRDDLRTSNLIPNAQPYGGSQYGDFAYAGTETIGAGVLAVTGDNAIVDWVLLELRSSANPITVIARKAALIQRDGDIVNAGDGTSAVVFNNIASGNYYVVLRHRNHLGVMTANTLSMSSSAVSLDFTSAATVNYQLSGATGSIYAQKNLANGKRALWEGNMSAVSNTGNLVSYQGNYSDSDEVYFRVLLDPGNVGVMPNYVVHAYDRSDGNMDGMVIYQGGGSDADVPFYIVLPFPTNPLHLPNYVIYEQVPK